MKLSFAISSSKPPKPSSLKPSSSSENQSSVNKQFVTEFDPSKTLIDPNSKNPNIIPPIPNDWRSHKKIRNIDLPVKSEDPNLEFEAATDLHVESTDPNVTYGLNLRVKKEPGLDNERDTKGGVDRVKPSSSIESLMLNRFRNDLERLPEDRGFDEFEDCSVENFATALLKGYGWTEGKGVGKNSKDDVKVVEITRRTGREGLGFVNDMPMPPSNDSNGKVAKTQTKPETGRSEERKERVHSAERRSKHSTDSYDVKKGNKRGRDGHEKETNFTSTRSWLNSHIRVRIISKKLKGGRLYLQKGEIVDVVGPTTCDISMDNSRELIQGVEQEFLETALPRRGGPVLVLYGRHKGVYGNLQEKDMDNETAVVRDADTHSLLNVKLEQIAEYVGDPDDIGY